MEWAQLISTLGFPIIACCACGWFIKYLTEQHANEIRRLNEQHDNEVKDLTTAINNNTMAINLLCEKLTKGE